jgi:5-methylcytosine-specific restriction protein A
MGEVFEELDLGGLKELQELERKELEGKLEKIKVGTKEDNNEDFEDEDFELEEVDEDEDTDFEFEEVSVDEKNENVVDDLEEDEEDIVLTEIGTNELSSGATLVEGIDKVQDEVITKTQIDNVDTLLTGQKYERYYKEINIEDIVVSEATKKIRQDTMVGLTANIAETGRVLVPIDVIEMPSIDGSAPMYLLVHGARRVYGAVRNAFKTIPAYVWKFSNFEKASELSFLLGLVLNRQQEHSMKETWAATRVLEHTYYMKPSEIERLFNGLGNGDAMKLKDVMLGEFDEPRDQLVSGAKGLEPSYRLLQKMRKEEDQLALEDAQGILSETEIGKETVVDESEEEVQRLTHEEAAEVMELAKPLDSEELESEMFTEKLVEDNHQNRKNDGDDDLPQQMKEKIKLRDKMCCQCCSKDHPENASSFLSQLVVHHLIPVHAGGLDVEENLITLCIGCHHALHVMERIGKVLVTEEEYKRLTPDRQKIVLNAYNLARIAIVAGHKKGYGVKERKEVTEASLRHKYPGKDIKEDKDLLKKI